VAERPVEDGRPAADDGAGASRVLVALYAVFALAAGARAVVQLATRYDQAPLAYALSAFAAAVYVIAAVALSRRDRAGRRIALAAITVELVGVLVVGSLSVLSPGSFPDETVWSGFGRGYYYVPLFLPVMGLVALSGRPGQKSPPKSPPPMSPPPMSPPP
jgi:drug/metabolite transporter (DMT)-like permease